MCLLSRTRRIRQQGWRNLCSRRCRDRCTPRSSTRRAEERGRASNSSSLLARVHTATRSPESAFCAYSPTCRSSSSRMPAARQVHCFQRRSGPPRVMLSNGSLWNVTGFRAIVRRRASARVTVRRAMRARGSCLHHNSRVRRRQGLPASRAAKAAAGVRTSRCLVCSEIARGMHTARHYVSFPTGSSASRRRPCTRTIVATTRRLRGSRHP